MPLAELTERMIFIDVLENTLPTISFIISLTFSNSVDAFTPHPTTLLKDTSTSDQKSGGPLISYQSINFSFIPLAIPPGASFLSPTPISLHP